MKKERKPWTEKNGAPLPKKRLLCVSKTWSRQTWEEYESSLEGSQREMLFNEPVNYEKLSQKESHVFQPSLSSRKKLPHFKKQMRSFMDELSKNQKNILRMIFRTKRSVTDIAIMMVIDKSNVCRQRDTALKKLKEKFIEKAMEAYQKGVSLPYLSMDPQVELKERLHSACSKWSPSVWEKVLSNMEKIKLTKEEEN